MKNTLIKILMIEQNSVDIYNIKSSLNLSL